MRLPTKGALAKCAHVLDWEFTGNCVTPFAFLFLLGVFIFKYTKTWTLDRMTINCYIVVFLTGYE